MWYRYWGQVIPRSKFKIASLIVGFSGALAGGYWGHWLWQEREISGKFFNLPVGIISGFLSCFFVSICYLKFVVRRSWRWGILFGPLFGGMAGTIVGLIAGVSIGGFGGALFGMLFGVLHGLAVGLLSSLIFGVMRAKFVKMRG